MTILAIDGRERTALTALQALLSEQVPNEYRDEQVISGTVRFDRSGAITRLMMWTS